MNSELETLRHRARIAELLHKETKLKAQRMALQAAFYERAYKQATADCKHAELLKHSDSLSLAQKEGAA